MSSPSHTKSLLSWSLLCLVVAGAAGAVWGIGYFERGRNVSRAQIAALDAERAAEESVRALLGELELNAHNAVSNPRLVAAIRADVTRATLRDIFENEPWWQPFREAFTAHGYAPGAVVEPLLGTLPDGASLRGLVAAARTRGKPAAKLVAGGARIYATIAAPVAVPDRALTPVLVLARPLTIADLAPFVERLDGAVVVAAAGRPVIGVGPSVETERLRTSSPQVRAVRVGWTSSEVSLGDGVTLLAHVTLAADGVMALTFALLRVAICLIAALIVGLGFVARRRGRGDNGGGLAEQPSRVGKYALVNRIGGGGMADVYLAVSLGEGGFRRPCVVKRLRPELAGNPLAVAQFTDEARLASSLVHSNIVPIYDFGRIGSEYFLVEEYIPGRDLGRIVTRLRELGRPALPPSALAFVACEILRALEYAHAKRDVEGKPLGLVHRDVSPENVIVSLRGEVKLLDFGVLKTSEGRATKTEFGALKGNITFMSPEQARGVEVDARADLFSLGLVLYLCLRGEPLYQGTGSYQLLVKAGAGLGPDDLERVAGLPAPFSAVLRRALAPKIEDRYPDACAFLNDLLPFATVDTGGLAELMRDLFADDLRAEQAPLTNGSGAHSLDENAPASRRHAVAR